ncbi:LysR family transcriptional regulator [Streptomyces sp. NPDC048057]|uniref:LysR family transcriptional regulator n=1 Tax=Streptomyces sp. NPDC048057 TaxID=3155628 RepID=UPI00340594E1
MDNVNITAGQIQALLALGEHGSFTRAAEALGLTQSAVSRTIASLERRLGGPLVRRERHGVHLTALGQKAAVHARQAMAHLRVIEELAESSRAPQLRIGAVASALVQLVPTTVERLRREWPDSRVLAVQGDDDELAAWLAAETIDLAVTTQPCRGPRTQTEAQLEITDDLLAVLPRLHPLTGRDRVPLADLVAAGVADPGGTCGPLLAEWFAAHGVAWRPDHVVRDVSTVLAMATAGITSGVVPALAVPLPSPPGVALLPLDPPVQRTLYIRHAAGHHEAALLARMLSAASAVGTHRASVPPTPCMPTVACEAAALSIPYGHRSDARV